ncbi:MAG: M28 family peptidase [Planctomycetales bacterium]|nr:M28 family peptidase [Planctomycetales bacterium]
MRKKNRLFVNICCVVSVFALAPQVLADRVPDELASASTAINDAGLRAHIQFLADDLLEGRGPGSRGDRLAQQYIATQLASLGVKPAAPNGTWFQPVPLVGFQSYPPESIALKSGGQTLNLARSDDYIFTSGRPANSVAVENAELVFVGYGMIAPEFQWNDYKDVDVKGKVVVVMNNDPSDSPDLFAGKRRLYYGRWDYKYATAAEQGAVGAIIIHTTESAGYPYQVVQTSWSGEEFQLKASGDPPMELRGWFSEDASKRVFEFSGHDLDELRAAAEKRDFRPVALGTTLSLAMKCEQREISTANVLGAIEGSDETLKNEFVIFMAHHDHIGLAAERDGRGDNIYNGAVDNASGSSALLTIARAVSQMKPRPKRSIMFAAVGAEEQGLLGSLHFANDPPVPAGYLAAVVNIDGLNILGKTHDVNVIGLGKSSMDTLVQTVADWQGRIVTPDLFPDRGYYYRSDQFSLAKIGVPGVYLHSGIQVLGKPDGWGKRQLEDWVLTKYHQTSDEYDPSWNLDGAVQDVQLLFMTGILAADADELPTWTVGDEFEAARKKALSERE